MTHRFADGDMPGTSVRHAHATVERICILDGGFVRVEDGSIVSPHFDVEQPVVLSCNAYLIRHRNKWIMWDTGLPDAVFARPGGEIIAQGMRAFVTRTIASQFEVIGVSPDDVDIVLLSHAHFGHVGNAHLFRNARWIIQRSEYEAMFRLNQDAPGYLPDLYAAMRHSDIEIVEGDCDLFDDGALRLLHTPARTRGHGALLVRLPKTGAVVLSGDITRCLIPRLDADNEALLASMKRIAHLAAREAATIWINHDIAQSSTLPHAPAWIV